ncbi:MAG TPA: Ig-like domain-containing protein, partial [Phycisphaerales bacterium]|nr:Ig-like domain-containing protein [Phycisphaerales bacterium]
KSPPVPPLPLVTLDNPGPITGSSGPAMVVDLRTLPRPPRPFVGPRIVTKHVLDGERQKLDEFALRRQKGGLRLPALPPEPEIGPRGTPGAMFPGPDSQSSPFIPPDCTVAAGPNHVITTVNSLLAVWNRDGTLAQEVMLFGSEGLFGSQGAGWFVFDPRCLFDAFENRYVVVALEYYEETQFSSILIALSAPGNPLSWTTFRTDAKTEITGIGFHWFDYPGFGYDQQGYYVTGNLFSFGSFPAFRGVKFRLFKKQALLAGQTTGNFIDLNDFTRSFASVQAASHMGSNPTPYFISLSGTSTKTNLQIHAIRNPVTTPVRSMKVVQLENPYRQPLFIAACCEDDTDPSCGAGFIHTVDDRVFNAAWRGGSLYTAHHITSSEDVVTARWYQVATNNWPTDTSASPSFVQGGDIPGGTAPDGRPIHTFFPAIHVAENGDLGVTLGTAVEGDCAKVALSGRLVTDPPGTMSAPLAVKSSDGADQDEPRWGDFYGISVDPIDGSTFWGIGQYTRAFSEDPAGSTGWATWVFSFDIRNLPGLVAQDDGFGQPLFVSSGGSLDIDVLANDSDAQGLAFTIHTFDPATANGGLVLLSSGSGPDGRDQLRYIAEADFEGEDQFTYTIRNTAGQEDSAAVKVVVVAGDFRDPDDAGETRAGIDVTYYEGSVSATSFPEVLPSPYLDTSVNNLNFPQAEGVPFANSGRSAGTLAVFTGYIDVPATDFYDLCLRRGSGASLYFGDAILIDDDGVHIPADDPICGRIGLKKGTHAFRVEFFHASGPHGLMLRATGGPLDDELLPDAWYLRPVECIADFDNSGFVDLDDYILFVAAFELGVDEADVDGSGFVDTDDFDY